jgi:hypothetical protein
MPTTRPLATTPVAARRQPVELLVCDVIESSMPVSSGTRGHATPAASRSLTV